MFVLRITVQWVCPFFRCVFMVFRIFLLNVEADSSPQKSQQSLLFLCCFSLPFWHYSPACEGKFIYLKIKCVCLENIERRILIITSYLEELTPPLNFFEICQIGEFVVFRLNAGIHGVWSEVCSKQCSFGRGVSFPNLVF
jgi:hypothetical protein